MYVFFFVFFLKLKKKEKKRQLKKNIPLIFFPLPLFFCQKRKKQKMLWVYLTLAFTFLLQIPKYWALYDCFESELPYPIYPWSNNPSYSKSSLVWIFAHLIVGSALVLSAGLNLIDGAHTHHQVLSRYRFLFFSLANNVIILLNVSNLGTLSPLKATFTNIIVLGLLTITYCSCLEGYFFLLSMPTYVELICLFQQMIQKTEK